MFLCLEGFVVPTAPKEPNKGQQHECIKVPGPTTSMMWSLGAQQFVDAQTDQYMCIAASQHSGKECVGAGGSAGAGSVVFWGSGEP